MLPTLCRHCGRDLRPLFYDEINKLAATQLAAQDSGGTRQATVLMHELG